MRRRIPLFNAFVFATAVVASGCSTPDPDRFDELQKIRMTIKGQMFELWVADEPLEQQQGLMEVTQEEMADLPDGTKRGMIFVFNNEAFRSFWMKNVIIPLDIAFINSEGIVVAMHTMAPLDDRLGQYTSGEPARYAIETNAHVLFDLGLSPSDTVEIPAEALKRTP